MSLISHCIIILEVTEPEAPLPSLTFKASKYTEIVKNGKGEPVKVTGSQPALRGQRGTRTLTIETYSAPFQISDSKSMSTPNSNQPLQSQDSTKRPRKDSEKSQGEGHGDTQPLEFKAGTELLSSSPRTTGGGGGIETKSFVSGNPFVELTKGILHLHKDNDVAGFGNRESPRSEMLCMLSVPSTIECRDLIQYVAPFAADLDHIKIIRDTLPNQYMALLKFKSQKAADLFYKENNGSPFNSFEDDVCKLAYISRVDTVRSDHEVAGLPIAGHTELPTCPVCLERMDESVDGLLTVLCNHTFHTNCLAKWSDSSCPVCRYVQTPEMVAHNQCCECDSTESLWICLICGHIGCGRYVQGHAYKHFCETEHCYAIQPDNNRVWDYVGDTFVHRLLQNKGDGKLVEVGGGTSGRHRGGRRRRQNQDSNAPTSEEGNPPLNLFDEDDGDYYVDESGEKMSLYAEEEEKIDSIQLEFTHLLTSQLDAQRKYFEQKLGTLEQEMKKDTEALNVKITALEQQRNERDAKIMHLQSENEKLNRYCAKLLKKVESLTSQLQNETTANECLRKDRDKWLEIIAQNEKTIKSQETEIGELKEQVRDLMLYLDFGNKIQESDMKDEIKEGQVSVPESSKPKTGKSKRKN